LRRKAAASSFTYNLGRERVEALASELDDAVLAHADLTREDDVERLFAESREELGGLDACAAVAGVWPEEDVPLWQLPLERREETCGRISPRPS
jgi:NAD(P)-dependent dehydrogenase (short-subunit alcohol dehydrogenase family)